MCDFMAEYFNAAADYDYVVIGIYVTVQIFFQTMIVFTQTQYVYKT